jgi:hypothetical protein
VRKKFSVFVEMIGFERVKNTHRHTKTMAGNDGNGGRIGIAKNTAGD